MSTGWGWDGMDDSSPNIPPLLSDSNGAVRFQFSGFLALSFSTAIKFHYKIIETQVNFLDRVPFQSLGRCGDGLDGAGYRFILRLCYAGSTAAGCQVSVN